MLVVDPASVLNFTTEALRNVWGLTSPSYFLFDLFLFLFGRCVSPSECVRVMAGCQSIAGRRDWRFESDQGGGRAVVTETGNQEGITTTKRTKGK